MNVFVSIGERSASNYVYEIFRDVEGIHFTGITDERLEAIGFKSIARIEDLSVVGIVEALPKIPQVLSLWKRIENILPQMDALILCDAPAFNLPLLKRARGKVKKIIYFISPQVWAWKEGRARLISELVDHLVVILPFEVDFYKKYRRDGFRVHFVGHPLVDMAKPSLKEVEVKSFAGSESYIALLPGSRWSEIRRHTPCLKEVLRCLRPQMPILIPTFQNFRAYLTEEFKDYSVKVITQRDMEKPSYNAMAYAELTLLASGTAELEASLLSSPHVVFYRVNPITYFLGRLLVRVRNIALTNLILQKEVVPELVQKSPSELCRVAQDYLRDGGLRSSMREEFKRLRELLGGEGAIHRLRNLLLQLLYEG
ncbi:MAG: lipid-A-disaccharide synthase [Aquificaceae bacterium]|uniref:lipid-A-disaccharide synthase n=1 Tax=Hydrogenobacter sp. Uz 6-8 TaxID=3384828 RepID=UPI00309BBF02